MTVHQRIYGPHRAIPGDGFTAIQFEADELAVLELIFALTQTLSTSNPDYGSLRDLAEKRLTGHPDFLY